MSKNKIDIVQVVLGYTGRLKDPLGVTALSLQGFYSPGDLTDFNKDSAFQEFSQRKTTADYGYGRGELRRDIPLPFGFSWVARGVGQYSPSKLVATELFTIGGYNTVRGYDENIVSGDQGWLVVNELRTPIIPLGNLTHQAGARDWIQGLVFCHYGGVINHDPKPGYNTASSGSYRRALVCVMPWPIICTPASITDSSWTGIISACLRHKILGAKPTTAFHFGVEL